MGWHADPLVEMTADEPKPPVAPQHSSLISETKFSEVMLSIKASYPNAALTDGHFTLTPTDLARG